MRYTFFFLLMLVIIVGCSSQDSLQMKEKNLSYEEKLYKNKCGACHALYPKEKHTTAEWESYLIVMEKKAHLDEDEAILIRKYLLSVTKSGRIITKE